MHNAIAVTASAEGRLSAKEKALAREVGKQIAAAGCALVTGACIGLPEAAAQGAKAAGGLVIGFSPAASRREHIELYNYPLDAYDFIAFTGVGLKARNALLVRASDAVIALKGGMGTLNELTAAYDENKVIGVLEGTGGTAALLKEILKHVQVKTRAEIISEAKPAALVKKIVSSLRNRSEGSEDYRRIISNLRK